MLSRMGDAFGAFLFYARSRFVTMPGEFEKGCAGERGAEEGAEEVAASGSVGHDVIARQGMGVRVGMGWLWKGPTRV